MKKEDLIKSLEGLELSEEVLNKIYSEANRLEGLGRQGLEAEKNNLNTSLNDVNAKLTEYEETIKNLQEKANGNEEIQKELDDLKKTIKASEKATAEAKRNAQIEDALNLVMGDKKFVNDYTKNALIADIKSELNKEENAYKGISDIFNSLTKDKEGIFANPHQANQDIPPAGNTEDTITKEQFDKMGYKERLALYNENKELYQELTK